MKTKLWGVPLVAWGTICLALTVVWTVIWPDGKAVPEDALRFFVLRWFHALTWLLLALSAFIAVFNWFGGVRTAKVVAFLSLPVYLIFLATFVTS
jgi:hypothetical protein